MIKKTYDKNQTLPNISFPIKIDILNVIRPCIRFENLYFFYIIPISKNVFFLCSFNIL